MFRDTGVDVHVKNVYHTVSLESMEKCLSYNFKKYIFEKILHWLNTRTKDIDGSFSYMRATLATKKCLYENRLICFFSMEKIQV